MAQNHYSTKTKRRQKNSNRKDPAAATMAKLRELAAAEAKKSASNDARWTRVRFNPSKVNHSGQLQ